MKRLITHRRFKPYFIHGQEALVDVLIRGKQLQGKSEPLLLNDPDVAISQINNVEGSAIISIYRIIFFILIQRQRIKLFRYIFDTISYQQEPSHSWICQPVILGFIYLDICQKSDSRSSLIVDVCNSLLKGEIHG